MSCREPTINPSGKFIEFSARGTLFKIPYNLLEKKQKTLMYMLASSKLGDIIPIDCNNDGSIYLDVNPKCIENIIDYYDLYSDHYDESSICKEYNNDIFMIMDLLYLGILGTDSIPNILPHDSPIKKKITSSTKPESKYKFCNVCTTDNKIVSINISQLNDSDDNLICPILCGQHEEYIISANGNIINVWIGMSTNYLHEILSIIRDGMELYYNSIVLCYDVLLKELVVKEEQYIISILDNDLEKFINNCDKAIDYLYECQYIDHHYQNPSKFTKGDNIEKFINNCDEAIDYLYEGQDIENNYRNNEHYKVGGDLMKFIMNYNKAIDYLYDYKVLHNNYKNITSSDYVKHCLEIAEQNINVIHKNNLNIHEKMTVSHINKNKKLIQYLEKYKIYTA